jgi:ribosomal protein S27AE
LGSGKKITQPICPKCKERNIMVKNNNGWVCLGCHYVLQESEDSEEFVDISYKNGYKEWKLDWISKYQKMGRNEKKRLLNSLKGRRLSPSEVWLKNNIENIWIK